MGVLYHHADEVRSVRRAKLYFTDRGIEELEERRGTEQVSLSWLADRMRAFLDASPEHAGAVDRLATYLARDDNDDVDEPDDWGPDE